MASLTIDGRELLRRRGPARRGRASRAGMTQPDLAPAASGSLLPSATASASGIKTAPPRGIPRAAVGLRRCPAEGVHCRFELRGRERGCARSLWASQTGLLEVVGDDLDQLVLASGQLVDPARETKMELRPACPLGSCEYATSRIEDVLEGSILRSPATVVVSCAQTKSRRWSTSSRARSSSAALPRRRCRDRPGPERLRRRTAASCATRFSSGGRAGPARGDQRPQAASELGSRLDTSPVTRLLGDEGPASVEHRDRLLEEERVAAGVPRATPVRLFGQLRPPRRARPAARSLSPLFRAWSSSTIRRGAPPSHRIKAPPDVRTPRGVPSSSTRIGTQIGPVSIEVEELEKGWLGPVEVLEDQDEGGPRRNQLEDPPDAPVQLSLSDLADPNRCPQAWSFRPRGSPVQSPSCAARRCRPWATAAGEHRASLGSAESSSWKISAACSTISTIGQ